ncbi:MAG: suppressor of fused domain protein [Janthinobacterium lividum]
MAALEQLYPDQEPRHYGTVRRHEMGGPDPIDGLSAFKRLKPVPHWHIVTYGFSELYEKKSADLGASGYGFELTFRPACDPAEEEPPIWALNFIQNLARYVFRTGNVFRDGHWMPANGPIAAETDTDLVGIAFTADPELPAITGPFGRVEFLQVVGLTENELRAAKLWKTSSLLNAFRPYLPLLVSDLGRGSLLASPALAAAVQAGSARDGSSTGTLFADRLVWTRQQRLLRGTAYDVTLGAGPAEELACLLRLRLPFGRPLRLVGKETAVSFALGEHGEVVEENGELVIRLTRDTARALTAAHESEPGMHALPVLPRITWWIEESLTEDVH